MKLQVDCKLEAESEMNVSLKKKTSLIFLNLSISLRLPFSALHTTAEQNDSNPSTASHTQCVESRGG